MDLNLNYFKLFFTLQKQFEMLVMCLATHAQHNVMVIIFQKHKSIDFLEVDFFFKCISHIP